MQKKKFFFFSKILKPSNSINIDTALLNKLFQPNYTANQK